MMTTWRTIRLRNADGTSSVYKVHDGVNMHDHGDFSSSMSSASLPPEVIRIQYGYPGSPMPDTSMDTASSYYGQTLFSAHTQQPHGQSPNSTKKRKKSVNNCANKCNATNSPLCITFGVILSSLVIIGYVCLIVFLIPGSTKNRWNEQQDVLSSTATAVSTLGGDGSNHIQQQLSKQHLMQNGIFIGDSSPVMTRSSTSTIDGAGIPRGRSYNAIVTILDPTADAPQQDQSSQLLRMISNSRVSRKSDDAGEPVRRLRRRKRKQKFV